MEQIDAGKVSLSLVCVLCGAGRMKRLRWRIDLSSGDSGNVCKCRKEYAVYRRKEEYESVKLVKYVCQSTKTET